MVNFFFVAACRCAGKNVSFWLVLTLVNCFNLTILLKSLCIYFLVMALDLNNVKFWNFVFTCLAASYALFCLQKNDLSTESCELKHPFSNTIFSRALSSANFAEVGFYRMFEVRSAKLSNFFLYTLA